MSDNEQEQEPVAKPAYEVTINNPSYPEGEPFQIAGLGTFKNGSTFTVTQEEAESFRVYHSVQQPIVDKESGAVLGSSMEKGPTLLQMFKDSDHVDVVVDKTKGGDN